MIGDENITDNNKLLIHLKIYRAQNKKLFINEALGL